jgi:lipopolysaccharide/colanic/teichoic acid biosynthesis glycosyltransferase
MPPRRSIYVQLIKPALDRCVAGIALVVLGPLLVAIAIAVRINLGSPVWFAQLRPGKNGRLFHLYKFRTMTTQRDEAGQVLPDDQRLTPFGRWLRSTSLDELPEIWNVLRGDMSWVGPRPLLPQYLRLYTPRQARRHEVKPGITGLAQVSGRNAISWEQKFDADLEYVDDLSFGLDATILWKTVVCVLSRDGISAASHSTMPFFTGNDHDEQRRQAKSA